MTNFHVFLVEEGFLSILDRCCFHVKKALEIFRVHTLWMLPLEIKLNQKFSKTSIDLFLQIRDYTTQ